MHRRSVRQDVTPSRRRMVESRGHRRPTEHPRGLPMLLASVVLGIGALVGSSVITGGWRPGPQGDERERITLASVPTDTPELGLVYSGLKPARRDAPCAGAYELAIPEICTHGPDPVPAGLKVARDVSPVTDPVAEPRTPTRESRQPTSDSVIVRDQGGSALAPGEPALIPEAAPGEANFVMAGHDVACEGDGRAGKRVQVLYLHEFGTASRYTDYLGSIRAWVAGVDAIVDASAAETGGSRHIRFVTTPQCRVDVAEVQVPKGALDSFGANMAALDKLGYNRTDRKYLIFADRNVYCGIGTFVADRRPGQGNRNNGGPSYGRIDAGCWGPQVAARELAHTLGSLQQGAPHSDGRGRCTDGNDIFCPHDAAHPDVRPACPEKRNARLFDCNHDDYFSTDPKPGSYLAKNWNIAQNEFLLQGDGGADLPALTKLAASPRETPSSNSAAAPTSLSATGDDSASASTPPSGAPAMVKAQQWAPPTTSALSRPLAAPDRTASTPVQAVLETRDATSTSVRLMWSASAPLATYDVAVDGVTIATTVATRARLVGLRPDTAYRVTISDRTRPYQARATAQTAPAARPARDSWFVLTNSLTGGAADMYAARTANGTPVVLSDAEGGAQQQWKLNPAGIDFYSLQSKATGLCVAPQNGDPAAGVPLVQTVCSDDDDSQRFQLRQTDHGFSLSSTVSGLVVGVGSQRFGAHRVLVLQYLDGSRHQSWTALPG